MKNSSTYAAAFRDMPIWVALLIFLAALMTGSELHAQTGPTPYPDPKNESAWPGVGPIRVFPWMVDNRNAYWTERDKKQGAIVFAGDSFLGNWYLAKVKIDQAFPQVKSVANRAIGGEVSRGLLFRFQEDVLDLHPEAVVILIGDNDLSCKAPTDEAISNITAMLDMAHKAYPAMPIILCNIAPRNSPAAPVDPAQVTELNTQIAQLAQGKSYVTPFDTFNLFAKPDGTPDPQYLKKDLLHPSDEGYTKLAEALQKVFAQLKLQ